MESADIKVRKVFNNKKLIKSQLELIKRFHDELKAEGKAKNTIANKLLSVEKFGLFLKKPYKDATKKDTIRFFSGLNENYKESSLNSFKINLKSFYKWIYTNFMYVNGYNSSTGKKERKKWKPNHEKDYPEIVSWIKIKNSNTYKLPEELLLPKEIKELTEFSPHKKAKAIINLLYDGALRVGELTHLKIKNLVFDVYGGQLLIPEGKTGRRKIRLIDSIPYLKDYLDNEHPHKDNPNSYLFINSKTQKAEDKLQEQAINILLRRITKKTTIKKNVYPHIFRHSRLTELAKILTEQQLKVYAGWTRNSNMASIYVHLSDEDVGKTLLMERGLIQEKGGKQSEELTPRICIDPSCNHSNPVTNKFCSKCHRPLDFKAIQELEKGKKSYEDVLKNFMENNTDFKEALVKAFVEKGVNFN